MFSLSLTEMRRLLSRSTAHLNQNKLRGTAAEIDFRTHLANLGFGDRVSQGGWIARRKGPNIFAHSTVALFPEVIEPDRQYPPSRQLPAPSHGLHTICATFHQSGIASFYCAGTVEACDSSSLRWQAMELGVPVEQPYRPLVEALVPLNFLSRERSYNFLRYQTDTAPISDSAVPEEFSKEHLRVSFNTPFIAEMSNIDGIFWGQHHTYVIEIEERAPDSSRDLETFFALRGGTFTNSSFLAKERGTLHPIYVIREIDNERERNLVQWWFITFDQLAQFASWVPQAGGTAMGGGRSSVVRVPRAEFTPLTADFLHRL